MSPPPADTCPLCSNALSAPETVTVCGECCEGLRGSGAMKVHMTGEYPAFRPIFDDTESTHPGRPARPRTPTLPGDVACSMCEKPGDQVKKLLVQGEVRICNECTALCADIFAAELGDDWR